MGTLSTLVKGGRMKGYNTRMYRKTEQHTYTYILGNCTMKKASRTKLLYKEGTQIIG